MVIAKLFTMLKLKGAIETLKDHTPGETGGEAVRYRDDTHQFCLGFCPQTDDAIAVPLSLLTHGFTQAKYADAARHYAQYFSTKTVAEQFCGIPLFWSTITR